jgi:hypothetical protein
MSNDAFVGFRIPTVLKRRVVEIAEETKRSMSQAFILLLERGIEAYEEDGILVDTRSKPKPGEKSGKLDTAKKQTKAHLK